VWAGCGAAGEGAASLGRLVGPWGAARLRSIASVDLLPIWDGKQNWHYGYHNTAGEDPPERGCRLLPLDRTFSALPALARPQSDP